MKRIIYALKKGFYYRQTLARFLEAPCLQAKCLAEITPERLDKAHVAVLVLDFDGVLGPHGAPEPNDEAKRWLTQMAMQIGEQRMVILTNKPMPSRVHYFRKHFPGIELMQGFRKKPYPDGLMTIALQKGVPSYRLLLVDDRLLTGVLATLLAKTQAIWFTHPYSEPFTRPVSENFFKCLRIMERFLIKWLNFKKGAKHDIRGN